MWDDINPKSTQFSILVFGLSNGFTKVDGPDGKEIVRVKTLQLNFKRIGDDDNLKAEQVKFMGYKCDLRHHAGATTQWAQWREVIETYEHAADPERITCNSPGL